MNAQQKEKNRLAETTLFHKFKKYIVYAESLREFCEEWHRKDKIADFESDYESHKQELIRDGFTIIPASTSKTGEIVSYYGKV